MSNCARKKVAPIFLSLVFATFTLIFASAANAEEMPQTGVSSKRLKICLALSGGGARGAAHLGVLKVLEEYRVPIHCIAGTSMGALVGGAYASGMSTAELDEVTKTITTELLFKERPPRNELTMRRKKDDYTILFSPELAVKDGKVTYTKGLVSGVQLETVLRSLSRAKGYHKFDQLPIPFRAVATDLVTGKAVIFKEGELANVMRASMSVPGAVAPAEVDGMLLVDGMLTENLPVATARAMGADIIIAVNVGTPLLRREELNGIFGVVGQMLSILTEQNVEASLALLKTSDILISPELGNFKTGSFDDLPKIAPLGDIAARKVAERLSQLSIPAAEYATLRQRQQLAAVSDTQPVDEIRFRKMERVNPKSVEAVMDTKVKQPLVQKTVDNDMRRIYGSGDFEHVNYRFLEEPGRRVLAVDAAEKSWGPDYLRFGLGLSSDFTGDAYFNLLASYRKTWLNSLGAEWRTDLQVGRTASLKTEFYQPVNAEGSLFIAPHLGIERRSQYVYQGKNHIASYDIPSALVGLDVGAQFQRHGELRFGVVRGTSNAKLDIGPPLLPDTGITDQGALTGRLIFDRLDSVIFPREGWRLGANIYNSTSSMGADNTYTKWDADGSAVFSFGEHTFNFGGKLGGKLGSHPLPAYDNFQWGGFLQQSGYVTGQLLGDSIVFGRVMYYKRLIRGGLFEGAYGGVSLEAGKYDNQLIAGGPTGLLKSASVFVSVDTLVGPAYLGYGHAWDGNNSFYFYLGRPF